MTKIMHGNLPTNARLELWAGAESGNVICACGEQLKWSSRAEVGRLQWTMLRCTLPLETKVRREWHSAVRRTLGSSTDNARVINAAMAFWLTPERGVIHTAVKDELSGWLARYTFANPCARGALPLRLPCATPCTTPCATPAHPLRIPCAPPAPHVAPHAAPPPAFWRGPPSASPRCVRTDS